MEAGEDAALGRTRLLAASLSYGFDRAFDDAERDRLAVLHLFRDTVWPNAVSMMVTPILGDDAVPELAGLTPDTAIGLLDRAADIGLLTAYAGGYYKFHPALPWYFTALFTGAYGTPGDPAAERAARAYTCAISALGNIYFWMDDARKTAVLAVSVLRIEEANLRHALALARAGRHWADALMCLQGLQTLHKRTGRDGEWARLVTESPRTISTRPLAGR